MSYGRRQDGHFPGEHVTGGFVLLVAHGRPHHGTVLGVLLKVRQPPSLVLADEPVKYQLQLAVVNDHQVIALAEQSLALVTPVQHHFSSRQVATLRAKLLLPEAVQHFAEFVGNVGRFETSVACQLHRWVQILWQQGRERTETI